MTNRGVHLSASTWHNYDLRWWINELRAMGIGWAKLLDSGYVSSGAMCEALLNAGIEPIVRIYRHEPNPGTLRGSGQLNAVRSLRHIGVRYFEPNNEPNLAVEWKNGRLGLPDSVMDCWLVDAQDIVDLGGFPSFPALAQCGHTMNDQAYGSLPWYNSAFRYLATCHLDLTRSLFDEGAWLAVHDAVLNHFYQDEDGTWHFEYPYDPICQKDQPGKTVMEDDCSLIGHRAAVELMKRSLGGSVSPDIISTEGGIFVPPANAYADARYPQVTYDSHASGTVAMFNWLEENEPKVLAMCPWLIANERMGHHDSSWTEDAWYHEDCDRPVVAAMKAGVSPPPPNNDLEEEIRRERLKHVRPLNPDAALTKFGRDKVWSEQSDEFDVKDYRCKAFYEWFFNEAGGYKVREYVAYCKIPYWDNIEYFEV